jgi:hypothetical protein
MKVALTSSIEALMNLSLRIYLKEGFAGVGVADRSLRDGTYYVTQAINAELRNTDYQDMMKGAAKWSKALRFIRENKECGTVLPWFVRNNGSLNDGELAGWFRQFEEVAGDGASLLTLPRLDSTMLYMPKIGIEQIDIAESLPVDLIRDFSNEFMRLYLELPEQAAAPKAHGSRDVLH